MCLSRGVRGGGDMRSHTTTPDTHSQARGRQHSAACARTKEAGVKGVHSASHVCGAPGLGALPPAAAAAAAVELRRKWVGGGVCLWVGWARARACACPPCLPACLPACHHRPPHARQPVPHPAMPPPSLVTPTHLVEQPPHCAHAPRVKLPCSVCRSEVRWGGWVGEGEVGAWSLCAGERVGGHAHAPPTTPPGLPPSTPSPPPLPPPPHTPLTRVNGHAHAPSLGVHAEGCFQQVVHLLAYLHVKAGVGVGKHNLQRCVCGVCVGGGGVSRV